MNGAKNKKARPYRIWSAEEDASLLDIVRSQGVANWVKVSQSILTRSPKQCRERYHQTLKPNLRHDPITSEEGDIIEALISQLGNRWAEIARHVPDRSENAIKNWVNGSISRRRRAIPGPAKNIGQNSHFEKSILGTEPFPNSFDTQTDSGYGSLDTTPETSFQPMDWEIIIGDEQPQQQDDYRWSLLTSSRGAQSSLANERLLALESVLRDRGACPDEAIGTANQVYVEVQVRKFRVPVDRCP